MTDKKPTDSEIKSALEGAILNSKKCDSKVWSIEVYKLENALDLITRQRAEIERSEKENTAFGEIIKKQDDEISALRKDLLKRENLEESYSKSVKQFDKRLEKTVKLERVEAVKEFADEFERRCIKGGIYPAFVKTQLKNVINEMVGENK